MPDATGPVVLVAGGSTATVHPDIGGRLGQLDLGDGPLLRGPSADVGWIGWGCYPLLPWSNRLPGGRLRFGAIDAELPADHDDGSAIHGLAASCGWTVTAREERDVELVTAVQGGPFDVEGRLRYELAPGALRLDLGVVNTGERPVPVGIGIHPWFRYGPVRVPADERWPGEPLPTGPPVAVDGDHDLRSGTAPVPMDTCFTALTGTSADVPGARLHWDGPIGHVVVYSGEPGWVCVEPVTMANDGIAMAERGASGHGVQVLAPGDELDVRYRFERLGSER